MLPAYQSKVSQWDSQLNMEILRLWMEFHIRDIVVWCTVFVSVTELDLNPVSKDGHVSRVANGHLGSFDDSWRTPACDFNACGRCTRTLLG